MATDRAGAAGKKSPAPSGRPKDWRNLGVPLGMPISAPLKTIVARRPNELMFRLAATVIAVLVPAVCVGGWAAWNAARPLAGCQGDPCPPNVTVVPPAPQQPLAGPDTAATSVPTPDAPAHADLPARLGASTVGEVDDDRSAKVSPAHRAARPNVRARRVTAPLPPVVVRAVPHPKRLPARASVNRPVASTFAEPERREAHAHAMVRPGIASVSRPQTGRHAASPFVPTPPPTRRPGVSSRRWILVGRG